MKPFEKIRWPSKAFGVTLDFSQQRSLGFNPGLLQLQRSGLFLADRREQVLSHSVVTSLIISPYKFISKFRNRLGHPYGTVSHLRLSAKNR